MLRIFNGVKRSRAALVKAVYPATFTEPEADDDEAQTETKKEDGTQQRKKVLREDRPTTASAAPVGCMTLDVKYVIDD